MQFTKQSLLTGWTFTRWLRLLLGVLFAMQTIQTLEILPGFIAAMFLFQAITNTGCCSANGCTVPANRQEKTTEVTFEEIKSGN